MDLHDYKGVLICLFVLAIKQYVREVFVRRCFLLCFIGFLFVDVMHAATVNLYIYDVYNNK
jgi:hypothetical protein